MSATENSKAFLDWLENWYTGLKPLPLADVIDQPDRAAICSVDLINAFAYEGNLASPRVAGLLPAVVDLFRRAYAGGVRHFLMVQECHTPEAQEFKAFAPHGICGTHEAEMVPELAALPFAGDFRIIHKNSIETITGTAMERWLLEHAGVDRFIVVGDCTDLCVLNMALGLKLRANQQDIPRRVIVPENCVQTYDLPVSVAEKIGALPHDGELLHRLALYQMALNRIEVVSALA